MTVKIGPPTFSAAKSVTGPKTPFHLTIEMRVASGDISALGELQPLNNELEKLALTASDLRLFFSYEIKSFASSIVRLAMLPSGARILAELCNACKTKMIPCFQLNHNTRIATSFLHEDSGIGVNMQSFDAIPMLVLSRDSVGNICFQRVPFPPEVLLSHELGHALYAINNDVHHNADVYMSCGMFLQDCTKIINDCTKGVIPSGGDGVKLFKEIWHMSDPNEILNILPARNILGDQMGSGTFHRSDGETLMESLALDGKNSCGILIRLGHSPSLTTIHDFNSLNPADKKAFLQCCRNLIEQIKIDGWGITLDPEGRGMLVSELPWTEAIPNIE